VNRLLIVDGHAYAYRAFHAIRELRSPSGQATNAIYGFVKMLEKMRLALSPTHVMVVWDGGLSSERMAVLPDYKAQRPEMPSELREQLDGIGRYLDAAGIAQYCGDGIEADDYIGCLTARAVAGGWKVVIASADKDFYQLISDQVGMLNPNDKSGAVWTREQVVAKTGVEPGQVRDWLALMGDSVDNITGVPGVGPQTAANLLKQFGSVDGLAERLEEVKSEKLRQTLREKMSVIRRNQELVSLAVVPCEWIPEHLVVRRMDGDKLLELFRNWGFKGLSAALNATEMREKQAELI
jgi:DNA polymerase-1